MKGLKHRVRRAKRGFALVVVLFAVVAISIAVVGLRESLQFSMEENSLERQIFQAKLLAESGAALALHPDVEKTDPLLRQEFPDGRKIVVRSGTEGGRILINAIEEDEIKETIRELFILWGLDATEASIASDSLEDWVDGNDRVRTSGAETDYYAQFGFTEYPLNEGFVSLEQMLMVRGMDRVAKLKPDWRDYFTLYGEGSIDVNEAPADLLEAHFGCTPDAALNVVSIRAGADGLVGTLDDYQIRSLDEAQSLLGISDEAMESVSAWSTAENTILRIESEGTVGNLTYKLIIIADAGTDDDAEPTILARLGY